MSKARTEFCGDQAYLQRYLQERLGEDEESSVIEHIGTCGTCQRTLERLAASEAIWDRLGEHLSFAAHDGSETRDFNERERWIARLKEYLAPTDDPKMMGRLGSYEVCGLIGSGSTGIVLKALEPRLNRYVAIKILSPSYSSLGASRKRFEREGRAVAAVANEHVVPIFAVDEHRGLPYIVMQYVPGGSLLQRIQKEGPLETCEVARIGLQVATGLAAAHAQGIVHRDVKPANVMLENTVDRAMVTDFGLARVTDEATMTRSGTIAGTPQYMSPEQARGEAVDQRTDLFSLGSLMYAACTGRPPFRAETVYGVINRVCESKPKPVRDVNPEIDKWLVSFIERLMSKQRDRRFQTAEQVARILAGELAHLQNPTAVPRPSREWLLRQPKKALTPTLKAIAVVGLAILAVGSVVAVVAKTPLATFAPAVAVAPPDQKPPAVAPAPAADPPEPAIAIAVTEAVLVPQPDAEPAAAPALQPQPPAAPDVASTAPAVAEADMPEPDVPQPAPPAPAASRPQASGKLTVRQAFEQSFSAEGVSERTVRVDVSRYRVVVTGHDDEVIEIVGEYSASAAISPSERAIPPQPPKPPVAPTVKDGVMMIRTIDKSNESESEARDSGELGRLELGVPRDFKLQLMSSNGGVDCSDLSGAVMAQVAAGDIVITRVDGDVDVRTDYGDIVADDCGGAVKLYAANGDVRASAIEVDAYIRASGGDVMLGPSHGDVYAQTSGGDIEVREIAGPVSAHTSDGDVFVTLTEKPVKKARLSAAAGDVTIEFVKELGLDVTFAGKLDAPFVPAGIELGSASSGSLSFNDGSPEIEALSTTGGVTLAYLDPEDESLGGSGPRHLGGSALSGSGRGGSGLGGSGLGGSGSSESGLGGSGLGGSGLGGSGLGGSGLGGSGRQSRTEQLSELARAKTSGPPRPGALATVLLEDEPMMDGYTLYLPVSHDNYEGSYPVIVYLQGAYGVGGPVSDLNNWGLTRLIRDEHDLSTERNQLLLDSFIVVSPHIQDGNYNDEADVLQRILQDVAANYKADVDRIYVTGVSRGGHGSWAFPSDLPETFAAVAPMGGNPSGLDSVEDLRGIAIWVGHNRSDGVVDFDRVEELIGDIEDQLAAQFREATNIRELATDDSYLDERFILTSADSRSHDSWTDVYTSVEFYKWLLRQKRQP